MAKNKKKVKIVRWAVLTGVFALLTALFLFITNLAFSLETIINITLNAGTYRLIKDENAEEVKPDYEMDFETVADLEAHDKKIAQQLSGEGAVLLRNNGVLPLADKSKVSCFSQSSVDIVTCGGGSADIDCKGEENKLYESFTASGLDVNRTLWDFYNTGAGKNYRRVTGNEDYAVNEVPVSLYTEEVKDSFQNYNGAAIVVISRKGMEFMDMAMGNYVEGTNVLELNETEKAMMDMVKENFDDIVVILNTANPMELGFLDEYGVDACLWMGYAGQYGLNAVGDILVGKINPSGRLVDTFCYDNTTSPAAVGFYGQDFTNATAENTYVGKEPGWFYATLDGNKHYSTYQEGIYVGYRYYETRYEDFVLNRFGADSKQVGTTAGNTGATWDYSKEVAYAFGAGESYTTFEWSNFEVAPTADGKAYEVSVTVTNAGMVAGKEVVEVYFQAPYTEGGVEKSAVELCGFAKTDTLYPASEAGEGKPQSQTVKITVDKEEFTSYDEKGAKTYILDAGDYFITAAKNAHAAVNNILMKKSAEGKATVDTARMYGTGDASFAATYTLSADTTTYATSAQTNAPITNRFEDTDGSSYGLNIKYLSRSNWVESWPDDPALTATDDMLKDLCIYDTYEANSDDKTEMPKMGQDGNMTLVMMKGKSFSDSDWQKLLDQVTFDEMSRLIALGYHNTAAMPSIAKPATLDDNGPQGFTQALSGVKTCRCAYTDENVMAATWNVELMEEVGKCIGNDMLSLSTEENRISGLYGPAMNTHRTPYGGRNFEYYSEDGYLAGKIAAAEVKGIQSKGIYVYIKHFALNDQETFCRCVSTFATEQSIREIYLKPFQTAVVEGDAHAVMNSFARFGCTWSGAHKGLLLDVLRGEWGFDGFVLTDYNMSVLVINCYSFDIISALLAGTDIYDCSSIGWYKILQKYKDDARIVSAMRQATHRILYTVVNSAAMNGIAPTDKVIKIMPAWKAVVIVIDVLLVLATAAFTTKLVFNIVKRRKEKKEENQ